MIHFQRNIRIVFFIVLPILGFLLGWTLSLKISTNSSENAPKLDEQKPSQEKTADFFETAKKRTIHRLFAKPKDPKGVDLSLLWETWGHLEESYLKKDDFDSQKQIYGLVKGLVGSLGDPYTVFLTPKETKDFDESLDGEFEGIGAEIGIRNDQITVITPLKDSPAQKAGILPGDVIFKINGESTVGMSVENAVTKIRGPKGQKVDLMILRKGVDDPISLSIVRDTIFVKSVEYEKKDNVAYIRISQFGSDTVIEFEKILSEVALSRPAGIVIDLRNNGGGLLDVCVQIASEFLDNKVIVKTKGRRFGETGELMSGIGGAFLDIPLVVLINEGAASASEIFAGAIQDYRRGLILGEKSFGKGSVQNVIPLSDGSSLKVTVAEWITPLGNSINEKGIIPDEVIHMNRADFEAGRDPVLERALQLIRTEELNKKLEELKKKKP